MCVGPLRTRHEYVRVGSDAAILRHTVLIEPHAHLYGDSLRVFVFWGGVS